MTILYNYNHICHNLGIIYKWLDQYLIIYLANFAKSFEFAIVIAAAIIFLLVSLFLTIRYLIQLPNYYIIEVTDVYGKKAIVEKLKVVFRTCDAADTLMILKRSTLYYRYYH